MTAEEYKRWLIDVQHYKDVKISGNRYFAIYPLLYTHAIITGEVGDEGGFDDRWCYHSYEDAKRAFDAWDGAGEPDGWHRHPMTGRRRDKNGKEYINP